MTHLTDEQLSAIKDRFYATDVLGRPDGDLLLMYIAELEGERDAAKAARNGYIAVAAQITAERDTARQLSGDMVQIAGNMQKASDQAERELKAWVDAYALLHEHAYAHPIPLMQRILEQLDSVRKDFLKAE